MTALTRTGRQRCPKGAPYEGDLGHLRALRAAWLTTEALGWGSCMHDAFYAAWLTTEVLGRGVCVRYATRDGVSAVFTARNAFTRLFTAQNASSQLSVQRYGAFGYQNAVSGSVAHTYASTQHLSR